MLANMMVENNKNKAIINITILDTTSENSSLMSSLTISIFVSRKPMRFLINFCDLEISAKILMLG